MAPWSHLPPRPRTATPAAWHDVAVTDDPTPPGQGPTEGWPQTPPEPLTPPTAPPPSGAVPPPPPPPGWGASPGMGSWGPPPPAQKPGVIPLRPLGVAELLDGAITAIRRYPRSILVPSFVVALALGALGFLTSLLTIGIYDGLADLDPETASGSDMIGLFGPTLLLSLATAVFQLVATVLLTGVVTAVMGQAVLGREITLDEAWSRVRPQAWRLIGLALLSTLIVFPLLMLCLVPGIWVGVGLSLASAALVLERCGVGEALGRSWTLVKGAWWRTFGALLLMFIIYFVISAAVSIPFSVPELVAPSVDPESLTIDETRFVINTTVSTIGSVIATTITLPFIAAVVSLIYINRRMRVEGLDITLARQAQGL